MLETLHSFCSKCACLQRICPRYREPRSFDHFQYQDLAEPLQERMRGASMNLIETKKPPRLSTLDRYAVKAYEMNIRPKMPTYNINNVAFDPQTGYPANRDTELWISSTWQGFNTPSLKSSVYFRVPYSTLAIATSNFSSDQKIGGGASCVVYSAELYDTPVAVKALKGTRVASEIKQFAAEMALLANVRHPNICRLLGVSTDGDRHCLVLEYCPGGSLDKRLKLDRKRQKKGLSPILGWKARLQMAVGIARGLLHLHSLSPAMIHRDVKAQNILLLHEDSSDWSKDVKVADFGTVRENAHANKKNTSGAGDQDPQTKTHTHTEHVVGTRAYMPAEYITHGHVSEKTDTFSFAILLIELLTSLDCAGARSLVELADLPVAQSLCSHPTAVKLWPPATLAAVAAVANRCSETKYRPRSTIRAEIEILEDAGAGDAAT